MLFLVTTGLLLLVLMVLLVIIAVAWVVAYISTGAWVPHPG
jgi:hypothetical protein